MLTPSGKQPPFDIFERLKTGTWDVHRQIEKRVRIFDPEFGLANYVQLLQQFYGFWAPLETKLSQVDELNDQALGLRTRMKSYLLEMDLRVLGCDPARLPRCDYLPAVDDFWDGLGCLYVLEGSTLGGQIIARRIESHLQLRAGSGAAFFSAYGKAVGERWAEYKSYVAAHATEQHSEKIVRAARQTFDCLSEWLGETGSDSEAQSSAPERPRS